MSASERAGRPVLRVVRGDLDTVELAALVTALSVAAAARRAGARPAERPVSAWRDHARQMRPALTPGPGAWRASAWPR